MIRSSSTIATFFRTLPDTLQQPAALAMIGSIGAHLLVFATLPAFTPATDNPEDEVRRVQIVDLPQRQDSSPRAASGLGLPPVPKTSTRPQVQPMPPIATNPNTPPSTLLTDPSSGIPIPIPPPNQDNASQDNDYFNRLLNQLRNRPPKPDPAKPKPSTASAKQTAPNPPKNNAATPPKSPNLGLTPNNPKSIADSVDQSSGNNQPTPQQTTPSSTITPDQLAYRSEGTDQDRGKRIQYVGEWYQSVLQRRIPGLAAFAYVRQPGQPVPELPYPTGVPAIGNFKQNEIAIGVLIGKDGKLLAEPELIGSTGYKILNEKAIAQVKEDVKKLPLPPANTVQPYIFEYKFKAPTVANASTPK